MGPRQLACVCFANALLMISSTAFAATTPGRVPMNTNGIAAAPVSGQFQCGTYRGNETQVEYFKHLNRRTQKKLEMQGVSAAAPTTEIFEEVWVVEDDGSLLFAGTNVFDTDNSTFHFAPNLSGGYDVSEIAFNYDGVLGIDLGNGDDTNTFTSVGFTFDYYGVSYTDMYVNSNGIIGFGDIVNPSGFFDNNDFFNDVPKIAAYFMDLNPAAGGAVWKKSEASKVTITWAAVPEYGTANLNTIQLVLHDDDSFDVTFNGIASTLASNGAPINVGTHPGGAPSLELISFSDDLPYSGAANAGIYEDYLNIANPQVNEVALFQLFYSQFPDAFFQINFFSNFMQTMAGFANELNIKNDVTGIGLGIFDGSGTYGSSGVLESRCNMNRLSVWPAQPDTRFFGDGNSFLTIMGQEAGHRWLAFVFFEDQLNNPSDLLLGRSLAHWSYFADTDHSSVEGGNWMHVSGDNYTTTTQIDYFFDVDEYTMGLRLPEEVSDLFYLDSPTNNLLSNRDDGTPPLGADATGTPVTVTVQDIIDQEGPRTPTEPEEEHDLRQAFILIAQNGAPASMGEKEKAAEFRAAWEDYFEVACDGRLTCNTSLTTDYPVAVVKGLVLDATTQTPISEITARSLERGFNQEVAGGGRYTFRYQADAGSGVSEGMTLVFEAAGYYPDTCVTSVEFDSTLCKDVYLTPVPSASDISAPLPNALYPNYPNPFNPTTMIQFDLMREGKVRLSVFDIAGRLVKTLVDERRGTGRHRVEWDGTNNAGRPVPSGIYLYKLEAGEYVRARKMALVK